MNGGVNGTMADQMDISIPGSPDNKSSDVFSDDAGLTSNHCENSNNSENSHIENNEDREPDKEAIGNNISEHSINDDKSNGREDQEMSNSYIPKSEESSQIASKNISIQNYDCNSNGSSAESTGSQSNKEEQTEHKQTSNGEMLLDPLQTDNLQDQVDTEEDCSDRESETSKRNQSVNNANANSDSEDGGDSQQCLTKPAKSPPDSHNGNSQESHDSEVHEIVSDEFDDCVETIDENQTPQKTTLRRSSRAIKRKTYDDGFENGEGDDDDDESDIEEVDLHFDKPIPIKDPNRIVEMVAKRIKLNQAVNMRKDTSIPIRDSTVAKPLRLPMKNSAAISSALSAQNLYQSIVARGTTVTPVINKTQPPKPQPADSISVTPSILPSLTDDMFVVEAPSFIVPYVYEKPSVKPFREFVDVLGKQLEDEKEKQEKERLQKEKEMKEKRDQEKRDRGEDISDPEDKEMEELKKKKKAEKKEQRRRKNAEDDDASWDGESDDSEDDIISDDDGSKVIVLDDSVEDKKDKSAKPSGIKSDNYFDCSLGKFFIDIGLSHVQEYVQTDLLKMQTRKLARDKRAGQSTKATEISIASITKNLEFSKKSNAMYKYPQSKCKFCSFKTESKLVMGNHLQTPHMKNNVYKCNYCTFEIRSPHEILFHMEAEHKIRGKLERAPSYHQCANCPFEDNGKGKLARHLIPCAKKFKPESNLAPPVDWEPPAKLPKITRGNRSNAGSHNTPPNRNHNMTNNLGKLPISVANMMGPNAFRPRGRVPIMGVGVKPSPVQGIPIMRGASMMKQTVANFSNNNGKGSKVPSLSITPLPRQSAPQPATQPPQHNKGTFVICEICDGYIKDLEQLRNHMQWIHKVKIHPKMIYNRPPLNCQKCQFRFFTDQGLERHLLGSHGLVTSSMQEAANSGKDAGRCPVCGRVYQWKLLSHVARDHNMTLKPAHLSYKCTVCTATFGMYKQFENHVYSAHSVVAKRVMDKGKSAPPKAGSLLKPLKISDEITIIPQPAKPATATK